MGDWMKRPEVKQGVYNIKFYMPGCQFGNSEYIRIVFWSVIDTRLLNGVDCFDACQGAKL